MTPHPAEVARMRAEVTALSDTVTARFNALLARHREGGGQLPPRLATAAAEIRRVHGEVGRFLAARPADAATDQRIMSQLIEVQRHTLGLLADMERVEQSTAGLRPTPGGAAAMPPEAPRGALPPMPWEMAPPGGRPAALTPHAALPQAAAQAVPRTNPPQPRTGPPPTLGQPQPGGMAPGAARPMMQPPRQLPPVPQAPAPQHPPLQQLRPLPQTVPWSAGLPPTAAPPMGSQPLQPAGLPTHAQYTARMPEPNPMPTRARPEAGFDPVRQAYGNLVRLDANEDQAHEPEHTPAPRRGRLSWRTGVLAATAVLAVVAMAAAYLAGPRLGRVVALVSGAPVVKATVARPGESHKPGTIRAVVKSDPGPGAPIGEAATYVPVLATFSDYSAAREAFVTLKQRYHDVLGNTAPDIETVTVPDGGTWHRLGVLPALPRAQAQALCEQLKAAGHQGCWIRPQG